MILWTSYLSEQDQSKIIQNKAKLSWTVKHSELSQKDFVFYSKTLASPFHITKPEAFGAALPLDSVLHGASK